MATTQLTNSTARKDKARKAGKCQLCGTKTKGHSVTIDYDKQKVVKSSAGKAKQGHAFYCTDCADKKVSRYTWKLNRKATPSTKGKGSRKQARDTKAKAAKATKAKAGRKARTTAKAAVKGAAKGKAKARKRSTPKAGKAKAKATPKAAAKGSAEPF